MDNKGRIVFSSGKLKKIATSFQVDNHYTRGGKPA